MTHENDPWLAPEKPPVREPASARPNPQAALDSLERVAMASLVEQRRRRRWGIFFKLLAAAYVGAFLFLLWPVEWEPAVSEDHAALVKLDGLIVDGGGSSAWDINRGLKAAFRDANTRGVIIQVNSPGGSAVQAGMIYDEIRRLRDAHPETPIYAVIDDIGASGGYYVAAAADAIYANRASIVGSIGVRADGFGFTRLMEHLGIDRRLLTAGEHKGFLDPFSPTQPSEVTHMQGMLDAIHAQFIEAVQEGRGDRLGDADGAFSGLVWTGVQSVELGLVDGLNDVNGVARELVGVERIVDFSVTSGIWERLVERVETALVRAGSTITGVRALY